MGVLTCTIRTRRRTPFLSLASLAIVSVALTLAAAPPAAFAQGGRTEITGTVVDQDKAVLPGVTVTVTTKPPDYNGPPRRAETVGS